MICRNVRKAGVQFRTSMVAKVVSLDSTPDTHEGWIKVYVPGQTSTMHLTKPGLTLGTEHQSEALTSIGSKRPEEA